MSESILPPYEWAVNWQCSNPSGYWTHQTEYLDQVYHRVDLSRFRNVYSVQDQLNRPHFVDQIPDSDWICDALGNFWFRTEEQAILFKLMVDL